MHLVFEPNSGAADILTFKLLSFLLKVFTNCNYLYKKRIEWLTWLVKTTCYKFGLLKNLLKKKLRLNYEIYSMLFIG